MDRTRIFIVWFAMAAFIAMVAYLLGASWYWALLSGVGLVAGAVGGATGFMYWKQKKLIDSAARFNIDLKAGKIPPADLRRMYFTGGQARKDAVFIASKAMNCSEQEAERRLSERISKQAANQEMARQKNKSKRRSGRPR